MIVKRLSAILLLCTLIACSPRPSDIVLGEDATLPDTLQISRASDLNIQLGMAYLKEQQYALAKTKFQRAMDLAPDNARPYAAMAAYYEHIEDLEKAAETFEKALSLAPDSPSIFNSYGVFLCEHGDAERGQALILKAADDVQFDYNGKAYENAGFCAQARDDFASAQLYFQKAITHNPRLVRAYLRLAEIAYSEQNYRKSQTYLDQYDTRANPTSASLSLALKLAEHFRLAEKASEIRQAIERL